LQTYLRIFQLAHCHAASVFLLFFFTQKSIYLFPQLAETESGIFRQILQGKLDFESDPWPSISESAKDLIRKMLERDPKKRLTAHEVLCHPWIVDDRVAPDKPLDSAVLSRLKQFSAMNKLKKMALRVIAERLSEEEIGGLKELFKMIDTDGSGTITFEELKAGLKRVGSELMESDIKTLMEAADIDNNGTIDYGEFLAATLHLNKMEREENLIAAFSFFDKDGSGYITVDELQQACKEFGLGDVRLDDMIKEIDQDNVSLLNVKVLMLSNLNFSVWCNFIFIIITVSSASSYFSLSFCLRSCKCNSL
ncbi:calcium-dependent protein kinase 11-like, partial [Carica papaya]|uniref:calcium-dependent protein kinase 11-like n=1 Tax=Carica papaya TaxID=3649 RepID=UPI000B8D18CE